ncbi:4-hydroxybenzoate octaprenyltransferase [uncultured Cardiobacterium sp.]|uniref:4-hydroxybenzoate octaprenyltransferase n=1 Tax=uncultured Cardiobacterium sp. TaxID=417619 RepID=UPI002617DDC2|nr:4-hydroxybenzoate octaprenyltransferase [uncultured Cardiobacterium sp.]
MPNRKITAYIRLMRLDGPIVPLLLAWTCLWGLWLAGSGRPPARTVCIFLLGAWLTHSAGCVFNDLADRNFDGHVERTRHRPLVRGEISITEALVLGIILMLLNFLLVLLLNRPTILLAIACGIIMLLYPLSKRCFPAPQLILGIALASPILLAQTALLGTITLPGVLLYGAGICWTLIYDTFYALVDRNDDLKIGLQSSAITMRGREHRFLAAMMALMLALLLSAGYAAALSAWYYAAILGAALLFAWELWDTRHCGREPCFRAFLHNNWVGAAVFLGLVLAYLP